MNWLTALAAVFVLWASTVWGASLTWDPDTDSDLAGYRIYQCSQLPCSKSFGTATLLTSLGNITSFNIGTPSVVQYYIVTAYDFSQNESGSSNVLTYFPPSASPPAGGAVSLGVAGAPTLPLHGTSTKVTVGIAGMRPTKVELSRDGQPPFAVWPNDAFFTLSADGQSLTGNWCISSSCWGNAAGSHVLNVVATYASGATSTAAVTLNVTDLSLSVPNAPSLPLHGTTTAVTVGMAGTTPTKVELSRDGQPAFAVWPNDTFFTLSADGQSLTGNWCISSSCWGNAAGAHMLNVVATYATGATAAAGVSLNVGDLSLAVAGAPNLPFHGTTTKVTVGMIGAKPTKVELSRDGQSPFAVWPNDTFFTLSADGQSLTGNWCTSTSCWGNVAGAHVVNVVATYADGTTARAAVALNVAD
ncbi:MAG TPA: hypothetical protein VL261_04400 [Nitrospira sp.]|nr:hypothetical protein [Nitrospira sp.]